MMDHASISGDLQRQGVDLVATELDGDGLLFHVNGYVEVRPLVNSYPYDLFVDASTHESASLQLLFRGGGE